MGEEPQLKFMCNTESIDHAVQDWKYYNAYYPLRTLVCKLIELAILANFHICSILPMSAI